MTKNKDQQAQEYAEKKLRTEYPDSAFTQMDKVVPLFDAYDIQQAFLDGYTACEQSMTDSEAIVIQGWVCRDKKDNALNFHAEKPYRAQSGYDVCDEPDWWESDCASFLPLDKSLFPDLTWESEPLEVEIIMKPKMR